MNFIQAFKMAKKSIMGNKKRSFLTMLGIIIGVSSVITLIGLVSGFTNDAKGRVIGMGTNNISVHIMGRADSSRTVSLEEVKKFANDNPSLVKAIIPMIGGDVTVKHENQNFLSSLQGTNELYGVVQNIKASQGRFLSALDVEQRQNAVLLGSYVARKLFPRGDSLNKEIKINGELYNVIGIVSERQNSTVHSDDNAVYIPYTSAVRLMQDSTLHDFIIQSVTPETVDLTVGKINSFLYKIYNSTDDYSIFSQKAMLKQFNSIANMLAAMMGGIAGISLLVGGIGIMNIMLVSVTERTREIGVRKAIGASRGSIMTQFLIEAVMISALGGVLGILLGLGLCSVISAFIGFKTATSIGSIMLAFGFSVVVGVFFGWSPANKASKLRPIEALRSY